MFLATRLDATIKTVCPAIAGVSVNTRTNPPTVRIDFLPAATAQQRTNAQAVLASFDWSDAAQAAWEADQVPERKAIRNAAAQAITDIDTYLALANPTNAQVAAQVRRLSQMMRAVIQRIVQVD